MLNKTLDILRGHHLGVNTTQWKERQQRLLMLRRPGINLLGGGLTIATTRPATVPRHCRCRSTKIFLYLNGITVIWKINGKLTSTTDLNIPRRWL